MRTLKAQLTFFALLAVLTTLTACGGNTSSSNNNPPPPSQPTDVPIREVVITGDHDAIPTSLACLKTMPRGASWQLFVREGFRRYNIGSYTWVTPNSAGSRRISSRWPSIYVRTLAADGFCGCEPGFQPACDPLHGGMTCVRVTNLPIAAWAWTGSDFRFAGTVSHRPTGRGQSYQTKPNGCYAHVAQSCLVGYDETCAVGQCQPLDGNTAVGVCVQGYRGRR